ncbi:uncharacterized tRNA/rRNA methyltransferase slr1673-like isoform X1 [Salvia hispanica]|uniref:uncharacterized tRNA/rRNA methyltransferase slr1673-like isoform X1 n=1 Tax=Salvia hispanica TaxID=49212 RepID=UPI002008FD81|nr:uncharacterized tRNA/rRNA methyltransferase slr1673-like isoform X1 [Salvia hispanica]
MQCLNKFFISASVSLTNPPNSQAKNPAFHATCRIRHSDEGVRENASKKAFSLPPNVNSIISTSNPFVKHCVKLRQSSSYRHLHGMVLVVGTTPLREIYSSHMSESGKPIIECLFVVDNCSIPEEIEYKAVHVVEVSPEVIRKISGIQSVDSVEVIALMRIPSSFRIVNKHDENCRTLFPFPHRILVLDGIQDPGNLGTLVRSATAFRWDGVFLLPGCCDPFNDKALRACRGASFQIPIVSGSWENVGDLRDEFQMRMLAGHPAKGDDLKPVMKLSKDLAESMEDLPLCLVLGSEGAGLSQFSRRDCELVSIPMAGEFESLNVSVAGGIFMYMLQRHK